MLWGRYYISLPFHRWENCLQRGCVFCLVAHSCLTICNLMDCSPLGSSVHGDSPGKNTGVGCHALLQTIFPTEGSNPHLLHCRQILYLVAELQGEPHKETKWPLVTTSTQLFRVISPKDTPLGHMQHKRCYIITCDIASFPKFTPRPLNAEPIRICAINIIIGLPR